MAKQKKSKMWIGGAAGAAAFVLAGVSFAQLHASSEPAPQVAGSSYADDAGAVTGMASGAAEGSQYNAGVQSAGNAANSASGGAAEGSMPADSEGALKVGDFAPEMAGSVNEFSAGVPVQGYEGSLSTGSSGTNSSHADTSAAAGSGDASTGGGSGDMSDGGSSNGGSAGGSSADSGTSGGVSSSGGNASDSDSGSRTPGKPSKPTPKPTLEKAPWNEATNPFVTAGDPRDPKRGEFLSVVDQVQLTHPKTYVGARYNADNPSASTIVMTDDSPKLSSTAVKGYRVQYKDAAPRAERLVRIDRIAAEVAKHRAIGGVVIDSDPFSDKLFVNAAPSGSTKPEKVRDAVSAVLNAAGEKKAAAAAKNGTALNGKSSDLILKVS